MDQEIERRWHRAMLWQRGFLLVMSAIGCVGGLIAARSGNGLPAVQLAMVAVVALVGLAGNVVHLRRRTARASRRS